MKNLNFINGKFQAEYSSSFINSYDPSTEDVIGSFPDSSANDINLAIQTAKKSFESWSQISRVKRAEYFWNLCRVLEQMEEDVTKTISLETGKSLNESKAEVIEALHMSQYCFGKGRESCGDIVSSELSERDSYIIRKPKGVVAVIAPWNFPFAIGGFWCAGPSILEGNTVVFKPSELTPLVGQKTAEIYEKAGFPSGVFNMIHGDGNVGSKIVKNNDVNHICFTGSADVGMLIRMNCAESWNKTCSCEMGSKSAVMVFDDCDIDLAVSACINSAFKLSGQRCVSAGRLLVHRSVLKKFKERFLYEVGIVNVKNPFDKSVGVCSVEFGPLISKDQMERVQRFNELVRKDKDATVLYDEPILQELLTKGWFLRPFVYEVEWSDKEYLKQEVFGPHVAIIPFDTIEDAIRIYNDTDFGLSLGVITNDFRNMRKIRNLCDAGMIYFNLGSIGAESHLPFGGIKKSGNGWPSAAGMFDAVVHKVAVSVNHSVTLNFPQGLK